MTTLKSQVFQSNVPMERIVAYLSDNENFRHLLPSNQISDFKFSIDQFSFKFAGQIELALEKIEITAESLHFKGLPSNPIDFELFVYLKQEKNHTSGFILVNAQLNPMMKMIIQNPLQKFLSQIADNLALQLN